MIVQHHKLESSVEKWDYCIQGQGHSKGSKCQWMFVRTICSEPHNILLPNLVWLCSFISQSVMQKYWFTVFNVRVTARAYIIRIWVFPLYLLNFLNVLDINQPSLPTPFTLFLYLFLSYGPFICISFHKFSRQLSAFSLCSSDLISALFSPVNYISRSESLPNLFVKDIDFFLF